MSGRLGMLGGTTPSCGGVGCGEMLRVGARVRVETLRVVLERLWVDRQGCLRDVDDVGDKGVGSDDALRW